MNALGLKNEPNKIKPKAPIPNIVYNLPSALQEHIGKDEVSMKRERKEKKLVKKQKINDNIVSKVNFAKFSSPVMRIKKTNQSPPQKRSKSEVRETSKKVKFNLQSNLTLVFDKKKLIGKSPRGASAVPGKSILKVLTSKKTVKKNFGK